MATKTKAPEVTPSKAKATKAPPKMAVTTEDNLVRAECEGAVAEFRITDGRVYLNGTELPLASVEALLMSGISTRLRGSINGAKTADARKSRFTGLVDRLARGALGERTTRTTDPAMKLALAEAQRLVRAELKAEKPKDVTLKDYVAGWRFRDSEPGQRSITACARANFEANREEFLAWAREELAKPKRAAPASAILA